MNITFHFDGSVTVQSEADPSRETTIPAGLEPAERDRLIAEFAAAEPAPPEA